MPECRVVPCYKMFLKELKEIVSSSNFNMSSQTPPMDRFSNFDVEHFTLLNKCDLNSTIESVNRGIQTNFRADPRKDTTLLSSKAIRKQVVG